MLALNLRPERIFNTQHYLAGYACLACSIETHYLMSDFSLLTVDSQEQVGTGACSLAGIIGLGESDSIQVWLGEVLISTRQCLQR